MAKSVTGRWGMIAYRSWRRRQQQEEGETKGVEVDKLFGHGTEASSRASGRKARGWPS
jgi:hypothetical protein